MSRRRLGGALVCLAALGCGPAPGAGLGLAICREIMSRLGGAIRHLPGSGGTTFRVELPRADMALAIAQPASG